MFKDLPEGKTHYVGDGCIPPHIMKKENKTSIEVKNWEMDLRKIADNFFPCNGCENCRGDLHQGCDWKCVEEFKRARQFFIEINKIIVQREKEILEDVSILVNGRKDALYPEYKVFLSGWSGTFRMLYDKYDSKIPEDELANLVSEGYNQALSDLSSHIQNKIDKLNK